jgi:CubicO group peptidase (beta-lactamase class C family)
MTAEHLALPGDVAAAIRGHVEASAARRALPAVAYGVVAGGEVVAGGALGSDREGGAAATTATAFRIASMTKSFTAAAVLVLRDEGRIRLDDHAADLAPELAAIALPTADAPALTVRHLLTMSAGLATDDPWADRHLDASPADMDALLAAGAAFAVHPGTAFQYSNLGYAMLGRIVERVTAGPLARFVTERLLHPLGMAATAFDSASLPASVARATGYRSDGAGPEPDLADGGFGAMGGLWSTVEDLARWVEFFCDAFPPRDDPDPGPLRRSSRREMQQVQRAWRPAPGRTGLDERFRLGLSGYGMGLNAGWHAELGPMVTHAGGLPGYGSSMRWLPERGVGVVALANATYAPMSMLTLEVLELLGDHGALPPTRAIPNAAALSTAAADLAALFGAWDGAAAADLFADNVFLDTPEPARRDGASRLAAAAGGPFRVRSLTANSATDADAVLAGLNGSIHLELQLSPLVPPRVQWYEATLHLPPRAALVAWSARLAALVIPEPDPEVERLAGLAPDADRAELARLLARAAQLIGPCHPGDPGAHDGGGRATFRWHGELGDLDATIVVDGEDQLAEVQLRIAG